MKSAPANDVSSPLFEPKERRRILEQFIAWGDPARAVVAMIGYEEGGEQWGLGGVEKDGENDRKLLKYRSDANGYAVLSEPSEDRQIGVTERMQCYFNRRLRQVLGETSVSDDHEYWRAHYCRGWEVAGNLFPLSRPGENHDWDDGVRTYLDFTDTDALRRYYDDSELLRHRLANIARLGNAMKCVGRKTLLLFMGVQRKSEDILRVLFPAGVPEVDDQLSSVLPKRGKARRTCDIYESNPVVCFVQHPSRGWFNEVVAEELIKVLVSKYQVGRRM